MGLSIGASVEETGLGRLLVGDLDASASSVFTPEIAVGNAWDLTIDVFRPRRDPATGTWSFDLIDSPRLAHELNSDVTLFPIDVDDDSVYLGSPTKTTAPSVFQPVVMLNSPPIHFDVFGNDIFDVSGCWASGGCSHDSFYSISNGTEMAVTTEVRADWATSTAISGSVGVALPFVQASVEASFETSVGDGFSKLNGSSNSFEMTVDALAYRSDWIFGTRSDYDVFEYPIYQGQDQTTPFSHVVSIVPTNTISVWTPSTDIEDLDVLQDHQTGNVLSYDPIVNPLDPQENEAVKVNLPFGVGQTAFTISPNSSFSWALDFSQMTNSASTQTSEQSVTAGVSAAVSGGAFGVTASFDLSTEGSYATGSVNTHETTVTTTSGLDVTLGDLDGSLSVGGFQNGSNWANYTVKPYAYWSYSGALVVDFGVDLPTTANGVDSFWQTLYGGGPDFTFSMPLRNEMAKTGIAQGNDLERRTRDILATPLFPALGETVTIEARVQNYSLYDTSVVDLPIVDFFWGDPAAAGIFLGAGSFDAGVTTIPARGDAIVRLADFVPPSGIDERSKIYVSIYNAAGAPSELRSDNNTSWNYAGFRSLPQCANGFDDDADGYVDFPDDPDCLDANGVSEVPEPGLAVSLAAGILALARLRRQRPGHGPGRA